MTTTPAAPNLPAAIAPCVLVGESGINQGRCVDFVEHTFSAGATLSVPSGPVEGLRSGDGGLIANVYSDGTGGLIAN